MSTFAPGPWTAALGWDSVVVDEDKCPVAVVLRGPDDAAFAANKRLILAAPDLLHALTVAEWTLRCSRTPAHLTYAQLLADAAIRAALSDDDYRALCVEIDARGGRSE